MCRDWEQLFLVTCPVCQQILAVAVLLEYLPLMSGLAGPTTAL